MFALVGAVVGLVLLIVFFVTSRNSDQDKLVQNQVEQSAPQERSPAPDRPCAKNQTYDLIKRELFRHAAQLRGSDAAAFDQLSTYAVVRMENPVMESQNKTTGAINCSGSLSLDLPPGVGVVGGRHTLTADVDYTVQPAVDGSGNVVLLRNADPIIAPLATLARVTQPVPPRGPSASVETNGVAAQPPPITNMPQSAEQPPSPQSASPPLSGEAHAGIDCSKARTRADVSVCSNGGLAALDHNMATQYSEAMAVATPAQRALLRRTKGRFNAYRDRCPNRACIGDAYVGRMREIRDIMTGHWQSPH